MDAPVSPSVSPSVECQARVAAALSTLFGDAVVSDTGTGVFGVRVGSAWVNVAVRAGSGGEPVVTTRAWLVGGTDLTPEFLYHLAAERNRPPFGALGLDDRDAVFVEHSMPGEGISEAQVRSVVKAVADYADQTDDEIVARFGGIRMTDKRPAGAEGA